MPVDILKVAGILHATIFLGTSPLLRATLSTPTLRTSSLIPHPDCVSFSVPVPGFIARPVTLYPCTLSPHHTTSSRICSHTLPDARNVLKLRVDVGRIRWRTGGAGLSQPTGRGFLITRAGLCDIQRRWVGVSENCCENEIKLPGLAMPPGHTHTHTQS